MSKFKIFETDRLILKPTSEEDAEFIFELLNTPKWLKYIGDRNVKSIFLLKLLYPNIWDNRFNSFKKIHL